MRRLTAAAALVLAFAVQAAGQAAPAAGGAAQGAEGEQAVLRLTKEWVEAEGRRDRAALERIVAADFEGTAPNGNRVTRIDVMPAEGSAGGGGMAMNLDDLRARVFGETAVVTGRGLPKAQGAPEVRLTLVYARRQGGWQMVAGHISVLPAER